MFRVTNDLHSAAILVQLSRVAYYPRAMVQTKPLSITLVLIAVPAALEDVLVKSSTTMLHRGVQLLSVIRIVPKPRMGFLTSSGAFQGNCYPLEVD